MSIRRRFVCGPVLGDELEGARAEYYMAATKQVTPGVVELWQTGLTYHPQLHVYRLPDGSYWSANHYDEAVPAARMVEAWVG